MKDDALLQQLRQVRAVPVIRSTNADDAIRIGTELAAGGLTVIEATFTTPDVTRVIEELAKIPGLIVGAGTVLSERNARDAVNAGASFLVTPIWVPWLPDVAHALGVAAIPGAATPTEVWEASESGVAAVKVFPIARLGGAAYIKDLLAPLPDLKIMATGGANVAMARDLIDAGCIAVGLGSIHTDQRLGADVSGRARAALELLQ